MKTDSKIEYLIDAYTKELTDLLIKGFTDKERTYGFEYEFISKEPLSKEGLQKIYGVLSQCGFLKQGSIFLSESGMYITIEPGGQIEYCSPPLLKEDDQRFDELMVKIQETNRTIKGKLDIEYISVGYIPDRADAPMILDAERYKNLHTRMASSGTRGREMMKGTASIHLHARIMDIDDMVPLFGRFLELAESQAFKMSADRRNIWDNTDPVRCGRPVKDLQDIKSPESLIREIVRYAMNADDIGENVPFPMTKDTSFEAFLYHMTTIFTDVRLNLKGPTWELRTLDSQPISLFEQKWKKFIHMIENIHERI